MDESDIDRALRQSLAELERRIPGDVEAEMTGRDKLGRPLPPVTPPKRWDEVAESITGHQPPDDDL